MEHMNFRDYFSFKIGGPAGFGIKSVGLVFARVATRSGYQTFTYSEYPSLIRGGHNSVQTVVAAEEVTSQVKHTDFLVALDQATIDLHKSELRPGSAILFDKGLNLKTEGLPEGVRVFALPLAELVAEVGGKEIMRNTLATAAMMALNGGEIKHLKDLVAEEFKDKPKEVTDLNFAVIDRGYKYVRENLVHEIREVLKPLSDVKKRMVINGNEAIARGAVAGGLQFAAIYPMTPTSNVLHNLAPWQEKFGFVYKQPEDEIAAIGMALGAAHAGARSLVATSGGGFALMAEAYGLAGITETPVVIIEGMRGGPATGLPTWTEQGDLRFVLHAHQSDFPRIVIAPGDVKEAFELTMKALNLADKYQTPVLVLVDKMICESDQSYELFNYDNYQVDQGKIVWTKQDGFKRYQISEDGVSPRTVVGSGNYFYANADEHDEIGYSNEDAGVRVAQMNKRMKKLETCRLQDMGQPAVYGPEDAEVTLVSWGSNKGAILEALEELPNVNFIHNVWMNPFPVETMRGLLQKARYLINIEGNYSAQYAGLVAEQTGIRIADNLLKYDGRPIYPEEIVDKVKSISK